MNRDTPQQRRLANLKLGPEARRRNAAEKRRTEREYLRAIVDEFSTDDAKEILEVIKARAKDGDKDAWAWLGKFVFGGGRVSLQDVISPSIIRRTR